MPSFAAGPNYRTPFGKNEYLGSTRGLHFEGRTFYKDGIRTETIDTYTNQKVLQPGYIVARITSGDHTGKIGTFKTGSGAPTDGRQTKANIVGINNTFLPWQLMERDVEVAVLTHGVVDPDRVYVDTDGAWVTLTDAITANTLAATDLRTTYMDITFRVTSSEL